MSDTQFDAESLLSEARLLHLDEADIAGLMRGELDDWDRTRVVAHLDRCLLCERRVRRVRLRREGLELRALLAAEAVRRAPSRLTLVLGRGSDDAPFLVYLDSLPHLLVAGSSREEVSAGLVAMTAALVSRAAPEEVRLILMSGGNQGLNVYEDIPHLLAPVIRDPRLARNALGWALGEMERRYALQTDVARLPQVVLIIEELAELRPADTRAIEVAVCRLARRGRGVGIHLIVATSVPSANVLTGRIKVDIRARLAFPVMTAVDSTAILNVGWSAERLRTGEALLSLPLPLQLYKLQTPWFSAESVLELANSQRSLGQPVFDDAVLAEHEEAFVERADDRDELYEAAVRLVVGSGERSASLLQRTLRIGLSRAVLFLEMMEAEGILPPRADASPVAPPTECSSRRPKV